MTWPASAGIAVYSGSSSWGTSLTAPSGSIVGTSDSQNLTNKTVNGVTPTAVATGFTVAGGTTSKTLTVSGDATISGTPYTPAGTDVALADGGTGASLSDPGANTLLGWDDTDNAMLLFTIGTGLSYDHATHTLSSTGGSGSGVFEEATSVIRQASATAGYDEDFVFGSPQLDDDTSSAHDARIIFDKSKGFFAAGKWEASQINDANRGNYASAFGYNTTASGDYSHAEGYNTTASGIYSHTEGFHAVASGDYSHAEGYGSKAYLQGQYTSSGGSFNAQGDAQYSRLVLHADTTEATPEVMYIENSSAAGKLSIPASTCWRFDGVVIATTKNCSLSSSWTIKGVIHRDASNNTEVVWSTVTEDVDEIDTAAAVTCTANDTNEALNINITGKSETSIRWVAYVELAEVAYP